ncbi:PspA/IM30 family protein [Thermogemmatispora sp.]|uniref:PspA/IM30 family protein n=1 Tax=Thermogemmatispora sp. TaxID=1968838 RepID=UPI0035E44CDE
MNLLERVLTLLRINIDAFIEKAPDPQSSLRQLQLDMRNQLVQVKTQVATAIATAHQLQRRAREKQEEAATWLKKVEQALRQGNEEAARSALLQYNEVNRLALRYEQQRQAQEQLARTMRDVLQQLESRLRELETTSDLLEMKQRQERIQQRALSEMQRRQQESEPPRQRTGQATTRQPLHPRSGPSAPEAERQAPTTESLAPSLSSSAHLSQALSGQGALSGQASLAALEKQLRDLEARHQAGKTLSSEQGGRDNLAGEDAHGEEEEKEKAPSASRRGRSGPRRATSKATTRTTDALDRTTLTDLPLLVETLQTGLRPQDDQSE